ncbi:hypothetical protein DR864_00405 [Runella rosea]|uniref:Uncharacterized protein n=1 Tax=Runella rosea TaxID=2259595 RepID=A0A344TC68_9BACT|nr:hypothetical protein [Runella rosea]AXE16239.1 hypothetical protein DR864_00130 [Runella rosea]AXE16294.1 hypothetical protein DR864_00405 [Runella rosea]
MSNQTPQTVPFVFPEKTERVQYKHIFTEKELLELGEQLNKQLREKNQMELDKKSAVSTWKSRIEAKDAEINITGNFPNDRYKFEPVEAKKMIDASTLCWNYFHPENWELIETVKLTTKEVREYFPKRKNLINKTFEWYNPYTDLMVDSRPMSTEELQLTIDEELSAAEKDKEDQDDSPFGPLDETPKNKKK